jgi:hypothetical protein
MDTFTYRLISSWEPNEAIRQLRPGERLFVVSAPHRGWFYAERQVPFTSNFRKRGNRR